MSSWVKCDFDNMWQAVILRSHGEGLRSFGFSVELQPVPPEAAGPQLQPPAGLWCNDALCASGQPSL